MEPWDVVSVKWKEIVPLVDAAWDANACSAIKSNPNLTLGQEYQGDSR